MSRRSAQEIIIIDSIDAREEDGERSPAVSSHSAANRNRQQRAKIDRTAAVHQDDDGEEDITSQRSNNPSTLRSHSQLK